MNQVDDRSVIEILHKDSICTTTLRPTKLVGNVSRKARSVVCGACGHAGDLAFKGHAEEVRTAWAVRNGYTLVREEDGLWKVIKPRGGRA